MVGQELLEFGQQIGVVAEQFSNSLVHIFDCVVFLVIGVQDSEERLVNFGLMLETDLFYKFKQNEKKGRVKTKLGKKFILLKKANSPLVCSAQKNQKGKSGKFGPTKKSKIRQTKNADTNDTKLTQNVCENKEERGIHYNNNKQD